MKKYHNPVFSFFIKRTSIMRWAFLIILLLVASLNSWAQPENIKIIMAKARAGEEITEAEEAAYEKWLEDAVKQMDAGQKPNQTPTQTQNPNGNPANAECPAKKTVPLKIVELTRESYVALAKELMTVYGAKSGDLPGLKSLIESSKKSTDGADMGALFVMQGAGSASIYVSASSAVQNPTDILTANNLGVALKDMGEFSKAAQILKYADKVKPNVGLVICNLGWVYREMGYPAEAKLMFEKALKVAPEMTAPYLGLGLIAKCEGNMSKAKEYLRKALNDKYSAAGIKAYKQAKAAQPATGEGDKNSSAPDGEKEQGGAVIPELPVFEDLGKMELQQEPLENYISFLDSKTDQLIAELKFSSSVIRKQQVHAIKNPDNSIVFNRDFAKEIMQFGEITDLLFGENSNYGQAQKAGTRLLENTSKNYEKDLPALMQMQEKGLRLQAEELKLMEELMACGNNEICRAKVEEQLAKVEYEAEQNAFQMCKLAKGDMEVNCANAFKNYKLIADALNEAVPDYYAFTNPVLERMYSPSFNEFYNIYRELFAINHLKIKAGFALNLAELASGYNEMKCVEPEPPAPPVKIKNPKLNAKDKAPCPLGEDGISGGIGALSFELSCTHVKISGGEGILWSVKRDFNKHETIIWGGVGVKGDYGKGNVTVEATIGAEITIGDGDVVKDIALTSSVKAGLGGLAEGEVSGRMALEGGPSFDANAGITTPGLPDLGGLK